MDPLRLDWMEKVPTRSFWVTLHFWGQKQSQFDKQELYQDIYSVQTKAVWVKMHKIPEDLIDDAIA